MRKFAAVVTMATLAVGTALIAAPAGASVAAKNTKFCNTVKGVIDQIDVLPTAGTSIDRKEAASTAKALRKAAKSAPPKIKSAINKIANVYRDLGNGDSIIDVLTSSGLDALTASVTVGKYYAKNCTNLPSVPG